MKMPPFGTTLQSLRGRSMRSWAGLTLGGFARRYSADRNAILGRQAVRLKHALVVAGLLLGLVGSAKADVDIAYSGKLTQLPESALFSLIPRNRAIVFQPGRNLFRLWGADISGTKLPVEILDFEYRCYDSDNISIF